MESQKQKKQKTSGNFFATVSNIFRVFARKSSVVLGSAWTFAAAILIIVAWGLTGPKFHYSDTWQLIINTGTTIVTFLMAFLIQNTQNRDAKSKRFRKVKNSLRAARLVDKATRQLSLEKCCDSARRFGRGGFYARLHTSWISTAAPLTANQ